MVKSRSGEDQAIQQCDGDADRDARLHVFQHTAATRTMDIQPIPDTRVSSRQHVRLAVDTESDVTDESFIDDGVDRVAIVPATAFRARYRCSRRLSCGIQEGSPRVNDRE